MQQYIRRSAVFEARLVSIATLRFLCVFAVILLRWNCGFPLERQAPAPSQSRAHEIAASDWHHWRQRALSA
jgi:hypothetical protein